jgi:CheY-like chemotaxis protein
MAGEPKSNVQKLTKSIEMMLKTVLAGAGYASKQMEVVLGRRLIVRGTPGSASVQPTTDPGQIDQRSTALTVPVDPKLGNQRGNGQSANGPVILMVEPQASLRTVMRLILERGGYRVLEAENGATALKIMTQGTPQLVLQDLALPDMGSFGLLQWLRTIPGGSIVPTLAMSESSALLEQARSRQAGFSGYLCRPCLPSYLLQTVYFFLPTRGLQDGMPAYLRQCQACGESATASHTIGHSRSRGRILVIESNDYQCLQLVHQLAKLGFEVISAREGREALNQVQSSCPDVIISDPLVPGLDGFALCLELRKYSQSASIPVVLSPLAAAMEIDAELAQVIGAAGYVSRTPDSGALVELLRTILRKKPVNVCMETPSILPLKV